MNTPENILVLVKSAYDRHEISPKEAAELLFRMLGGIDYYSPPAGMVPDPLDALNREISERFNPAETIADLLTDLLGDRPTPANCHQAAEVIRQLLNGRPANRVPLMVEDR